ncbi:unnamed protein product [Echinostoma caproni]|uniref:RVT_N domain-containing protein n=1 Tax=Echinostoma caproni TaxID=27848 RepID=A0A183B7U1_9TREM|nr:unnamed protein product [Echinostoma caproni]
MQHPKATTKMAGNFGTMNVDLLRSRVAQLAWDDEVPSIEGLWGVIKQSLHILQEEFAPWKPRRHLTKPIWWRAAMNKAIKRRNQSWRLYKISGSRLAWTRYTALRNAAVEMVRTAKRNYELMPAKSAKNHAKKYYGYVKFE